MGSRALENGVPPGTAAVGEDMSTTHDRRKQYDKDTDGAPVVLRNGDEPVRKLEEPREGR